jgi:o-succinylbenzoate---CoA ligase
MDWVRRAARARPDAPAVVTPDRTISYGELDAAADGAASIVWGGGMEGDGVALWGDRSIDTVAAFWGIQRAGSVPVMIDPGLPVTEQRRRTRLSGARGLWAPPEGGVDRLVGRGSFDPPGEGFPVGLARSVLFTSGSEGLPKQVTIGGSHVAASVAGSRARIGNGVEDPWLCVLPLHHVGGLSILWRQAEQGAAVVLEERFDERRVAASLGTVSFASLVPTMLRRVLEARPESGATVLVGGAPVSPESIRRSLDAGILALQTYGMTETTSQVCTVSPERVDEEMGTVGRPIAGAEVRVVVDDAPVVGSPGRIEVRGPMVAAAAGDDERSRGWFTTGDLGQLDRDGRLTVIGRADAVIVTGGENVHPATVERVLETHPGVRAVRVIGEPDERWGERVVALVSGDVEPDEVRRWAAARLPRAEVPKEVRVIDDVAPKMSDQL